MSAPHCTLVTGGNMPRIVNQALGDLSLRPVERLAMWHLAEHWLDFVTFSEVKSASLACEMGIEDQTAGRCLRALVSHGYLEMQKGRGRSRSFRMFWSRRRKGSAAA